MYLIITESQQESKYLVSAESFYTLCTKQPTVKKLMCIISNIALC